jgi:hypothetical protein
MTNIRGAVVAFSLLFTVGLLGMPITGWAQGPTEGRTYGTTSDSVLAVSAVAFTPSFQGHHTSTTSRFARVCDGSNCELAATVTLPAGALITRIELDGCVFSDFAVVSAALVRTEKGPQPVLETLAEVSSSEFDLVAPACTNFPRSVTTPRIINSRDNYYVLQVNLSDPDAYLLGVQIFYRLQVSPAPAVASFGDVPTNHPFFGFIEALKASGITGGCQASPPLYCPDQALTRGQMAVFLSKALGLHFAP